MLMENANSILMSVLLIVFTKQRSAQNLDQQRRNAQSFTTSWPQHLTSVESVVMAPGPTMFVSAKLVWMVLITTSTLPAIKFPSCAKKGKSAWTTIAHPSVPETNSVLTTGKFVSAANALTNVSDLNAETANSDNVLTSNPTENVDKTMTVRISRAHASDSNAQICAKTKDASQMKNVSEASVSQFLSHPIDLITFIYYDLFV